MLPAARQLAIVSIVLVTPIAAVAVMVPLLERYEARRSETYRIEQAEQAAAARQPFERAFAATQPHAVLAFCRQAIEASFAYSQPVVALHYARDRTDAYVRRSLRVDSLHRVSCRASGIVEERVEHPLANLLAARQAAELEAPAGGVTAEPPLPDLWGALQGTLALAADAVELTSIEWLHSPLHADAVQRITRQRGGEVVVDTIPPDAPTFPSLSSARAPPEGLAVRAPTRWTHAVEQAFERLERVLPAEARILQARISDDTLQLWLRGPLPGLEAPAGLVDIDAWGEITTWLYPLEGGGADCGRGITLAGLRARFEAACATLPGCRPGAAFAVASYSCAGDAGSGRWALQLQPR